MNNKKEISKILLLLYDKARIVEKRNQILGRESNEHYNKSLGNREILDIISQFIKKFEQ